MQDAVSTSAISHPFLDGKTKQLFIGGEWVDAHGGVFDCVSPGTGEVIAQVACGDAVDIDRTEHQRPHGQIGSGGQPHCASGRFAGMWESSAED